MEFVGVFMIYLHTIYDIPNPTASVVAVKPKANSRQPPCFWCTLH